MKARILTGSAILLVILLLTLSSSTTAKNKNSCIDCHTDESSLKKLCKVPQIPTGEAEG